jgi:hypothetical protein
MVGFDGLGEALNTYCAAFSDGRGPDRVGSVHRISWGGFRDWLKDGETALPRTLPVGPALGGGRGAMTQTRRLVAILTTDV